MKRGNTINKLLGCLTCNIKGVQSFKILALYSLIFKQNKVEFLSTYQFLSFSKEEILFHSEIIPISIIAIQIKYHFVKAYYIPTYQT